MSNSNPILNNPYENPKRFYSTDLDGNLDYNTICPGRRIFKPDTNAIPGKQKEQKQLYEWNDEAVDYGKNIINLLRNEIAIWRAQNYLNTTRVTKELLTFWFNNPERNVTQKLFYAQQEAIETAIWLNEVAEKSNSGQFILRIIREGQQSVSSEVADQLPRMAFKMATGTGKTVVMACLMCYHFFNRQEYRNDTRFADYFLIVVPGITIKDRLGVLFVDTETKNPNNIQDYYHVRGLIPSNLLPRLENLNARLVITNYHAFEPKVLQGNKKSPFDGKTNLDGTKNEAKEDFNQIIKRTVGKFKIASRLLILNDEAHHCYLPKLKTKTTDNEDDDENARAMVWFSGLRELAKKFKLQAVYDLSATPYYLTGSGYPAYSLFPWVVSDFGLIEAIESGLVKIPFLPESDNTQELEAPILRDLYKKVIEKYPNAFPRKGIKKKKSDAHAEGKEIEIKKPNLHHWVKGALDQFCNHYLKYDEGYRESQANKANLFSSPPVFIAVCNNTAVSEELYKYVAGYEITNAQGEIIVVPGEIELFSNYDVHTRQPKRKPPTLLIDSAALEDGGQVDENFKKIFAREIEEFKREYARLKGQGSVEKITDAEILREVVNTVGKPNKLGAHIRCVVSVSMLTEGWDSNTVTHIMGLRAFGSQLLCEQVAGRALRRMSYTLTTYNKQTGEEIAERDKHKFKPENLIEKFPPEYAHIIGVPFKMFKSGASEVKQPVELTQVYAMPERQNDFEITFPNVAGYRVEHLDDEIKPDFSKVENFEIDCSEFPLETDMSSAFSADEEKIYVADVFEKRHQEVCFYITQELIRYHFSDADNNPQSHRFNKLLNIVRYWYIHKIQLIGEKDEKYRKLIYFTHPKTFADHIARGINPHINTSEFIRPVFSYYNKFSSTKYVNGKTKKETFETQKSHVNLVVEDSGWEGIAAKTLDQIENVVSYVKNSFLGFTIPYVKEGLERMYFPDFIAVVKTHDGKRKNLVIEISGMSRDKAEKKWYVENRWLPAVNAVKNTYHFDEWDFIEIANDIRDIKNQLTDKIQSM